ncbi:MAG: 50S ribosomal protein L25 [Treponema sp.]
MEEKVLNANRRVVLTKSNLLSLRKQKRIPAVMYDRHGKAISVDVCEVEFGKLFRTITESTILKVMLEGEEHEVFVKDYQYDRIKDKIIHVDFYAVERGVPLRTKVKVKFVGSPDGVRRGGVLETGITEVEVECLPKHLPTRLVVDVSKLELNTSLHVKDIAISEGVTILTDPEITIAALKFANYDVPAESSSEAAETKATE